MKNGKEEIKSEVKIIQEKEHHAFENKIFSYLEKFGVEDFYLEIGKEYFLKEVIIFPQTECSAEATRLGDLMACSYFLNWGNYIDKEKKQEREHFLRTTIMAKTKEDKETFLRGPIEKFDLKISFSTYSKPIFEEAGINIRDAVNKSNGTYIPLENGNFMFSSEQNPEPIELTPEQIGENIQERIMDIFHYLFKDVKSYTEHEFECRTEWFNEFYDKWKNKKVAQDQKRTNLP